MFGRKQRLDAYLGAVLHRFAVTLEDGTVATGVLVEVTERTLVFDDIKVFRDGDGFSPAAGRLYIDRINVRYTQLLNGGE